MRHYLDREIPVEILDALLRAALEAPSSWNYQARSIVAVTDPDLKARLTEAAGGQPQPREAPVLLVFVAEENAWREDLAPIFDQGLRAGAWSQAFISSSIAAGMDFQRDLETRGLLREYAVKDAMIAASFAMIAAEGMGLASGPMNGWSERAVKDVIGIGERTDLHIALLLAVGYSNEKRPHPGRLSVSEKVHFNSYAAVPDQAQQGAEINPASRPPAVA